MEVILLFLYSVSNEYIKAKIELHTGSCFKIHLFICLQQYDASVVPACECLKDTVARVLPYWHDIIVPTIKVRLILR